VRQIPPPQKIDAKSGMTQAFRERKKFLQIHGMYRNVYGKIPAQVLHHKKVRQSSELKKILQGNPPNSPPSLKVHPLRNWSSLVKGGLGTICSKREEETRHKKGGITKPTLMNYNDSGLS
jgi:hypothetical protein